MGVLWGFLDQSLKDTALGHGEIIVNFPPMTSALFLFDEAVPLWVWRRGISTCGSCQSHMSTGTVACSFCFFLF